MAKMSSQACQPWLLSITRVPPISRAVHVVDADELVEFLVVLVVLVRSSMRGKFSKK